MLTIGISRDTQHRFETLDAIPESLVRFTEGSQPQADDMHRTLRPAVQ